VAPLISKNGANTLNPVHGRAGEAGGRTQVSIKKLKEVHTLTHPAKAQQDDDD
jgi:hypothetical protein